MQHKILQTHKLNSNDFNRVNNTIFAYVISWLILKYDMVFKGGIYSVLVWKKKKIFWEELLAWAWFSFWANLAGIYLVKLNNRNTRTMASF